MRRDSDFALKTTTDIKVFLLFLLDNVGSMLDRDTLIEITERNTGEISFDYDECLVQLTRTEHLYSEEIDGTLYAVRTFFKEDATENITEKVERIILKKQ